MILLIVAAINDWLILIAKAHKIYASTGEPKKIVELDCGHFELYPL